MKIGRAAVITAKSKSGETGGAELLYDGLVSALNEIGIPTDRIDVVSDESSFEAIEETYLRCYDLDVFSYDAVISTKAPTYLVRHPNHICYLIHTMRVFYDMFDTEFQNPSVQLYRQQELIHMLDRGALMPPRTRKVFTIGNEVRRRLLKWNKIDSEVLHPALRGVENQTKRFGNYLFMPGRLHRWKRVDLIIEAMRYVKAPIKLLIAGTGEDEMHYRKLASDDPRIAFLGRVSDQEKWDLYANAFAIPFVPIREDFGYIILEAFLSEKPVLTCVDSGEPVHFVKDGKTGLVCLPEPVDIARKIDFICSLPDEAKKMGERGNGLVRHICWPNIVRRLISFLDCEDS